MCASAARGLLAGCAFPSRGSAPTHVTGGVDMDDPGDRIAQQAWDLVRCAGFRARFTEWTERFPALGIFGSPGSLLRLRRHTYAVREQVLAALVALVREGHEDASLLLLEMLRPGIAVRAGWLEGTHARGEAWQEMVAC